MKMIHKCPALKHGISVTSLTDKFYYGKVQPCCPSANASVAQRPYTDNLTPEQFFFSNEVNIPIGNPEPTNAESPKYGIDSFDDIFTKHRDWADEDGYVNEIVCDWCVKRASINEDNHLPYTDYTPPPNHSPKPKVPASKGLVFLGPLLLESICNFSCYICGSGNSTQWASIAKPIKKDLEDANLSDERTHVEKWYNFDHLDLNKNYTKKIKEVLYNTDMSSVQFVHLVGGEPLYGKMFLWFLELLDARTNLNEIVLTFNTNVSIFPDEKVLNILRKFKELRICLSLDGIGALQETTRPGVSWEVTNSNVEKWVAFRNSTRIIYPPSVDKVEYDVFLFVSTTLSVLNVNKLRSLLDYTIEKGIIVTILSERSPSGKEVDPLILSFVQFKPYLDINLIPVEIRKNWLIDKNDYPIEYQFTIDEYNETILYNTDNNGTVDKCLAYLSIVEKATNTKFSDANPEMYECLQNLNEQTSS